MNAKEYFSTYVEDDVEYPLNTELYRVIKSFQPESVFEFGCGQGKNLKRLGIANHLGIDVSGKAVYLARQAGVDAVIGDENALPEIKKQFDVTFTCSVLDHIQNIDGIVNALSWIARKAVVIAETNDIRGRYYFAHDYASMGFVDTGYRWKSTGDGAEYFIMVKVL